MFIYAKWKPQRNRFYLCFLFTLMETATKIFPSLRATQTLNPFHAALSIDLVSFWSCLFRTGKQPAAKLATGEYTDK